MGALRHWEPELLSQDSLGILSTAEIPLQGAPQSQLVFLGLTEAHLVAAVHL
jgi:hypothetical protein